MVSHPRAEAENSFESMSGWTIRIKIRGIRFGDRAKQNIIITAKSDVVSSPEFSVQVRVWRPYSLEAMLAMAAYLAPIAGVPQVEIERIAKDLEYQVRDELGLTRREQTTN